MESIFALESLYILDEPAEYTATYEELFEQASALESFADDLEGDLLVAVFEAADSDNGSADEASAISAKYRSGFEKIKKGKRTKNQKLVSDGQREVNEASNELKEAEKNADTAEKKAKLKKVAKIAIAVGGAVLLALLAYVGIKNRSKVIGVIRKLKKNPGSNVAQTVSEVKNAASTAAATPVEEKPVPDGEQAIHQQLSDVKQRVGKSISDRHEAAQKEIDAALKEIYSEPTPSKDSGRPSKMAVKIDKKLDELLIDSDTKPTPTASIKPREKTERQITADKIRADRAHKKELKDWKVVNDYDKTAEYSKDLRKVTSYRGTEDTDPEHIKGLKSVARMANRPDPYSLSGYSENTLEAMFDKCREKIRSLPDGPEKEKYKKMKSAIYLQLKKLGAV